jgi:hypothetical protein
MGEREVNMKLIKDKHRLLTEQEALLRELVQRAVEVAESLHETVDEATARRIAAVFHRGIDSELGRFAGTGVLRHHHAARLELHHVVKDHPKLKGWAKALRDFITEHQRDERAKLCNGNAAKNAAQRNSSAREVMKANPMKTIRRASQ